MAVGVTRRGRVNAQPLIRVAVDPATLAAAAQAAVDAASLALRATLVPALHPHAVVDAPVGVTRAFLRTPWQWTPRRLTPVLIFATLRG